MKYTNVSMAKEKKQKKNSPWGYVVAMLIVGMVGWFILQSKTANSMNPISIVANVSTSNLKETDGRTNILVLGSDKRDVGYVTSVLTDTILVASIGKVDKDVVLISIPRDLWVQTSQGYHMKINEIYTTTSVNPTTGELDYTNKRGITEVNKAVEDALGIPLHYYVMVNFDLFQEIINTLGGIDLTVDSAFKDYYYPVEGMEAATCGKSSEDIEKMVEEGKDWLEITPCRYETLDFKVGPQHMDGITALKFARSRHAGNNEGTDFARSKRQQKVIMAVKDKALSVQNLLNLSKIKDMYDIYSKNVETNMDFVTIQNFYLLSQQINFDKVVSVVLDDRSDANDGGLLYHPEDSSLYGGRYVLIPRTGDYSQIHAYVQKYIFGAN